MKPKSLSRRIRQHLNAKFAEGVQSIANMRGQRVLLPVRRDSDATAMASDWRNVGSDIRFAVRKYSRR